MLRQSRRQTLAHPNRQQLHGRLALPKSPCQVQPTPAKYLVRVDAMRPRYPRDRRAFDQRFFDDPPLLRDTAPLPRGRDRGLSALGYDTCNLPGMCPSPLQVDTYPKCPLREHGS